MTISLPLYLYLPQDRLDVLGIIHRCITEKTGRNIVICSSRNSTRNRVISVMNSNNIAVSEISHFSEIGSRLNSVFVVPISIDSGFVYDNISFIPANKLCSGSGSYDSFSSSLKLSAALKAINSLETGKHVVHRDYGVCLLEGIKKMTSRGNDYECLQLLFSDGRIYVPIERVNLISKFSGDSSDEKVVLLDSMKSSRWEKSRNTTKLKIDAIAHEILQIASARKTTVADVFDYESVAKHVDSFISSFAHIETDDQLEAINTIYKDLSSGIPMDRLICGDVGVGKTEVAIRAMFLVGCSRVFLGKTAQVAFLCPTTFLAQQNFDILKKRSERFGVKVVLLSNTNKSNYEDIKKQIYSGDADIVVGTHSLLQDSVIFKKLSLVVCDEEQTFGVAQKDRLKQNHPSTHFLSLSATPIPRTLYKAMTGIQDLSLITTTPIGRVAIKTSMIKFKKELIRSIIEKEKKSGGQTIVITPRIVDIEDDLLRNFSIIVPRERIAILHGKMSQSELEFTRNRLFTGLYDIVIATTIVASGIDFPVNNTIIINRPEMFGLSQLHQIRGRVGRRDKQAYCYLLVDDRLIANKEKMSRLTALQSLSHFGSSLEISHIDLEKRGGGNLLSKEQSGHIEHVSIHLYYELLQEAIESINGSGIKVVPEINIDAPICLPSSYTESLRVKLEIYRKLADIVSSEELVNFKVELQDRFGKHHDSIINLDDIVKLRTVCSKYQIARLAKKNSNIAITMQKFGKWDVGKILEIASRKESKNNFRVVPNGLELSLQNSGGTVKEYTMNVIKCLDVYMPLIISEKG